MEAGYGRPAVLLREGGTLPILPMFKHVLGADMGAGDGLRFFGGKILLIFLGQLRPGKRD